MGGWKTWTIGSLLALASVAQVAAAAEPQRIALSGSGSKFLFKPKQGEDQTLVVIVTRDPKTDKPRIQYFLDKNAGAEGALSRTTLAVTGTRDTDAISALFEPLTDPRRMPRAVLENAAGVPLAEALVSDLGLLAPYRVGTATILVPAGYLRCTQYRIARDDRTIDVWVSDRAGPFRLVQLNATGPKPEQNFELLLLSLISTYH